MRRNLFAGVGLALFTVVVEPVPVWLVIPGLLLVAGAMLAFSCWRIRSLEISYSTD